MHFQRTTAGGCCDCGDPDAWKRSGFCEKHPGPLKETASNAKTEAIRRLPEGLKTLAPVLIEETVQFVADTLLYCEEAQQVAQCIHALYKEIPRSECDQLFAPLQSSAVVTRRAKCSEQQYRVVLHHDDNHTSLQTTAIIRRVARCSEYEIGNYMRSIVQLGQASIYTDTLDKCAPYVSDLVDAGFQVSVEPEWLGDMKNTTVDLLTWLYQISSHSDGIAAMVAEAMRNGRRGVLLQKYTLPSKIDVRKAFKKHVNRLALSSFDTFLFSNGLDKFVQDANEKITKFPEYRYPAAATASSKRTRANDVQFSNRLFNELMTFISGHKVAKKIACAKMTEIEYGGEPTALELIVRNCSILPRQYVEPSSKLFHELILDMEFKSCVMGVFLKYYKQNSMALARGDVIPEDSIFDFSVQLFSVASLVKKYADASSDSIFELVVDALDSVLSVALRRDGSSEMYLSTDDPVILRHGRYRHCVENLENILNVAGLPEQVMQTGRFRTTWLHVLGTIQNSDQQLRRSIHQDHVEYESDSWVSMFNLCIRLHSLFSLFARGVESSSATTESIFKEILVLMEGTDKASVEIGKTICPFEAVCKEKDPKSVVRYPTSGRSVASEPTSFHIPLHRYYATLALQVLYLRETDALGLESTETIRKELGLDKKWLITIVDMPLRSLVMASQIQSNLWRRNGEENMLAQIFNYSSLPFCTQFQDNDLFLLQLGVLGFGASHMLALIVDRFELCKFFSLQSDKYVEKYGYMPLDEICMDDHQQMQLVEEMLRLILTLGTNLPDCTGKVFKQKMLRREVLHQLCVKPRRFSELTESATLPGGNEEMAVSLLEEALEEVATYQPKTALEPGRYSLKEGLMEHYNPYFLHLSREDHQMARDRYSAFRKRKKLSRPIAQIKMPLPGLTCVRDILILPDTVCLIQSVLEKVKHGQLPSSDSTETVITCVLHLLIHGLDTESNPTKMNTYYEACSGGLIQVLSKLHEGTYELISQDQKGTIQYLLNRFETIESCRAAIVKDSKPTATASTASTKDEQRKAARARAIAAMAKQRESFMMSLGDEEQKESDEGIRCILCHGSSHQDDFGYVAYVQESSVLSSPWRPSASKAAIDPVVGAQEREAIYKTLVEMESFLPTEYDLDSDSTESIGSPTSDQFFSVEVFDTNENEFIQFGVDMEPPQGAHWGDTTSRELRLLRQQHHQHHHHHHHHRGEDGDGDMMHHVAPRPVNRRSEKNTVIPSTLHLRTCHHAVHVQCLERYTTTLYQKSDRGEDFDGCQAIDLDASMTQFLCPLCKTLSNMLIPVSLNSKGHDIVPTPADRKWYTILQEQKEVETWCRKPDGPTETSSFWEDYFAETLWKIHDTIEKCVTYLWASCSSTIAMLVNADVDSKEIESVKTTIEFSRWAFELLHLPSSSSNAIYEVARRCCPLVYESKRERRKFDKLFEYANPCLAGSILGLLLADTFTCFVITCALLARVEDSSEIASLFYIAEFLDQLRKEFFISDEDSMSLESSRTTRSRASATPTTARQLNFEHARTRWKLQPDEIAILNLLERMTISQGRLKSITKHSFVRAIVSVKSRTKIFQSRIEFYFKCWNNSSPSIPSVEEILDAPSMHFDHVWQWCFTRHLTERVCTGPMMKQTCPHSEGVRNGQLARLFVLEPSGPGLVELPEQYDTLYSTLVELRCKTCDTIPSEPGLCLICGEILCCSSSCCREPTGTGTDRGECTKHALSCGTGVGIVLMLLQCRVVLISGSMAAYYPGPYVDAHGEEDIGLQRGRPLKLDARRYEMLNQMYQTNQISAGVSKIRNQQDQHELLMYSTF